MKIVLVLLTLLLLILLGLYFFGSTIQPLPTSVGIPSATGNDVANQRFLELGLQLEKQGDYAAAREAYKKAALAADKTIAADALTGIERTYSAEINPQLNFQRDWQNILFFLVKIPFLVILLVILVAIFLIAFSRTQEGIEILPAVDYTENKIGAGFHSLALYFINNTIALHQQSRDAWQNSSGLEVPQVVDRANIKDDPLTKFFGEIKPVEFSGVSLPVGSLFELLRQRLARRRYVLITTLHQSEAVSYLTAEIRATTNGSQVKEWQLASASVGQAGISDLAALLAFEILAFFQRKYTENTLQPLFNGKGLQAYTEGLACLLRSTEPSSDVHCAAKEKSEIIQSAIMLLEKAALLLPGYPTVKFSLGIAYIQGGQYSLARSCLEEIVKINETDVAAVYNLGLAYYYESLPWAYAKAETWFYEVISRLPKSALDESEKKRLRALAYSGLATVLASMIKQGDTTDKKRTAKDLSGLVEHYVGLALSSEGDKDRLIFAWCLNARGIAAYSLDNFPEAEKLFQKAYEIYPENPLAYGYSALTLLETTRPNSSEAFAAAHEARVFLSRALQWRPGGIYIEFGFYRLGQYYSNMDLVDKAEENYINAPRIAWAQNNLGEIYAGEKRFDSAVERFQKAIDIDRSQSHFWANLAYYTLSAYPSDWKMLKKAKIAANQAINLNSDPQAKWRLLDTLGRVLIELEEFDEAEKSFQQSLNEQQNKQNYQGIALLYKKLGKREEAIEAINKGNHSKGSPKWSARLLELENELLINPSAVP